MKSIFIAIALLVIASSAQATDRPFTLDVSTPYERIIYHATQMVVDTEDLIAQVEISNATVFPQPVYPDYIFADSFEDTSVNWIWVGDDNTGGEIGGYGHCTASFHDSGNTLVLVCNPGVILAQGNS